ncbi:uncharacterized protein LOC124171438 isoform X2 [Ischnura elegans]|uniref:uncharacterized protein LOC124171438 isoform X2 n=1 Tax=Ischnura elegans TaxID=197161 RepID=UPI001ED87A0F|nr:uncharacterized protein LOC124171438 isoform X2 [Ischnura elegans]
MPWPPRLSRTPLAAFAPSSPLLLLPLLVAALLPRPAPAATVSYADGQPEFPSQPEVTSDRNALARFFLQSLIEKEGRGRNPHSYAYGEEPDDWTGEGLSSKRSSPANPFKFHHQSPLKDIYPQLRFNDERSVPGETYESQDEDSALLDKEKLLAELLLRRLPHHSLHGSNAIQSPEMSDDDQDARWEHLSRLGLGRHADSSDLLHDLMVRHRPPSASGGAYSVSKRDPFGINARGFHDDVFYRDFGSFNPMKRTARSVVPESEAKESEDRERENKTQAKNIGMDEPIALPKTEGSYHKRSKRSIESSTAKPAVEAKAEEEASSKREERATNETPSTAESPVLAASKRRPEMDSSGFHGDTFNSGFGDFWTMKRNHGGREEEEEGRSFGKRRPEMDSSGFHGDTFNGGFGDFWTMKRAAGYPGKRRPEMDSSGFHGDTFSSGFGDFYTMKRAPTGTPSWGTLRVGKRRPEMDSSGFHGDTFNGGFGDFWTMKRGQGGSMDKRRPEMDSSGFHGDTFNGGFGDFWTMKRNALARPLAEKRRPEMDSSGFHGDTFHGGFGDFYTMKRDGYPLGSVRVRENYGKRRPEMDSSGFHGDTFNGGFGDFWTMKRGPSTPYPSRAKRDTGRMEAKRRPEMDSSGFHGDTFNSGFGDFWTMKRSNGEEGARMPMGRMEAKRRPEMDSSGFHGDTFNSGFGDFWTMKRDSPGLSYFRGAKRRPEMDSSGFHGDTFNSGFGDFWTMKRNRGMNPMFHADKRRPEMDSSGFHGDTFNSGFGDFWTMKRSVASGLGRHQAGEDDFEDGDGDLRVSAPEDTAEAKSEAEDRGKSSRDGEDEEAVGVSPSAADGKSSNKFDSTKE